MHRSLPESAQSRRTAGFTLIELMIAVAIIAILASIAVPLYTDYVTRSKIVDATTKLGDVRTQMEKCFMDQRTYANYANCSVNNAVAGYNADPAANFRITWPPTVTATTYLLTATGVATRGMSGFTFTVNQANAKTSSGPSGKYTNAGCWAIRKDGTC
jgi:type IV pilus assembly protein PilE